MHIQQLREVVLPTILKCCGNLQADHHSSFTSRLVDPLKLIYSSTQVSDVLVLTIRSKLINFVFQIFSFFIPEMPASFMSYVVQIIPIYFARIL
jgi:hypothetical protein